MISIFCIFCVSHEQNSVSFSSIVRMTFLTKVNEFSLVHFLVHRKEQPQSCDYLLSVCLFLANNSVLESISTGSVRELHSQKHNSAHDELSNAQINLVQILHSFLHENPKFNNENFHTSEFLDLLPLPTPTNVHPRNPNPLLPMG